jgi:hypothetical protein
MTRHCAAGKSTAMKHTIQLVITTNECQTDTQEIASLERKDLTPHHTGAYPGSRQSDPQSPECLKWYLWHGNVYKALG